jgi:Lipase
LIGHSLGAHVAGNVGRFFNGTIGRITALDPAGPLFHPESKDAINATDALFVDSVHTSAGILGQMRPSVDVSFYPNRGYPPQPGCTAFDFFMFGRCSHHRASLFFAESIYWPENFEGLKCDMDDIMNAPCQQIENQTDIADIAFMGEAVNRS